MPKNAETEKLILTSIRLPERLKSRLLHLQADGKIKSIQQAALDALDALATKLEKKY